MTWTGRGVLVALAFSTAVSCGGDGGTAPTGPTMGREVVTIVTITSNGADLHAVTVPAGSRVRFTNMDSRAHEMSSDPHPSHEDCPEINQVGFLAAGQTRETGNLVEARACGFHDHQNPGTQALRGSITIR